MAKSQKPDQFPSVLAFERKLVPSDGRMYAAQYDKRNEEAKPLRLHEKAVRGTISNRLSTKLEKDPAKLDAEVEKPNLQTVDSCSLPEDCDTLKLEFTLKVLPGVDRPSACNVAAFQESCQKAVAEYVARTNFTELSRRYATNLANGRFLWRNRLGAEDLEVTIEQLDGKSTDSAREKWTFDGWKIGLNDFANTQVDKLAELIATTLSGKNRYLLLNVTACARVGKGQEVYPSEELVTQKDGKSKVLYAVDGIAAMHSQKIGNAIRTIDTWYAPDVAAPIAVEAYGAVTNLGVAYRKPTNKNDFYSLFDKFGMGEPIAQSQEHYVMAMLVRGGVFGKSGKND